MARTGGSAAARKQSQLRVLTCRHEGGASLMASAFGKVTGLPGAVTATNGPGVTHLPVGCRDALLDGAPSSLCPVRCRTGKPRPRPFRRSTVPCCWRRSRCPRLGCGAKRG